MAAAADTAGMAVDGLRLAVSPTKQQKKQMSLLENHYLYSHGPVTYTCIIPPERQEVWTGAVMTAAGPVNSCSCSDLHTAPCERQQQICLLLS